MTHSDELSDLIGAIYDCVAAPDGWTTVLERVSQFVGGHCGHFLIFDEQQRPLLSIVGGADPASGVEYDAHYAMQDPRMPGFFARAGNVVSCQDVVDNDDFSRSALVNDFLIPWEARWCMVAAFTTGDSMNGIWAAMRAEKRGAFLEPDRDRLGLLLPHIRRAADLQFRLGLSDSRARGMSAALEALAAPVFLLDRNAIPLHHNSAAEEALAAGAVLVLRNGSLTSRRPLEAAAIAAAIRLAASPAPLPQRHAEEVAIGAPPGAEGRLLFYRLPGNERLDHRGGRAAVLAMWLRPGADMPLDERRLRSIWGLSAGEAALSLALAAGDRMADVAARTGVSTETLRTQLKNVFAKTGTHRQSDLVRLLHSQTALPLKR